MWFNRYNSLSSLFQVNVQSRPKHSEFGYSTDLSYTDAELSGYLVRTFSWARLVFLCTIQLANLCNPFRGMCRLQPAQRVTAEPISNLMANLPQCAQAPDFVRITSSYHHISKDSKYVNSK